MADNIMVGDLVELDTLLVNNENCACDDCGNDSGCGCDDCSGDRPGCEYF